MATQARAPTMRARATITRRFLIGPLVASLREGRHAGSGPPASDDEPPQVARDRGKRDKVARDHVPGVIQRAPRPRGAPARVARRAVRALRQQPGPPGGPRAGAPSSGTGTGT